MNAESWDQAIDWRDMLRALPVAGNTRKLRLWCVAWARDVIAADFTDPRFETVRAWFTTDTITEYARGLGAAEQYADGQLNRKRLIQAKSRTGGPWNIFHIPSGISRFTTAQIIPPLTSFSEEFGTPNGPDLCRQLRDAFGNPFQPNPFDPRFRTSAATSLASQMYDSRNFSALPILADVLQDAGCENADILDHCRDPNLTHIRGCWVVDLVLGLS